MTLCYFLPINPPVILPITLPVIAPNLGITGRITGEIMGSIVFNLHPMILSVSMPLIFWTKMNDIRLRPLAIFFGWTPAKKPFTQARQTHCVRLTTFFAPVFGRSKMWWSDASLTGFAPKTNTFTGVHLPSLGVSFRFGSPCFPFLRWTLIRIKTKSLPPSFYSVGQIASCHKTSL
ncbi:hypothetical protein J4727_20200 [Providencia rettgeri]|uniref:Uncharacterized protein n=1 Tax=Providencia rettgeri TaxID=587 RepID=A0A939NIA2_PRORE|nr:hypothetical protein [Providencia rettgeri]